MGLEPCPVPRPGQISNAVTVRVLRYHEYQRETDDFQERQYSVELQYQHAYTQLEKLK